MTEDKKKVGEVDIEPEEKKEKEDNAVIQDKNEAGGNVKDDKSAKPGNAEKSNEKDPVEKIEEPVEKNVEEINVKSNLNKPDGKNDNSESAKKESLDEKDEPAEPIKTDEGESMKNKEADNEIRTEKNEKEIGKTDSEDGEDKIVNEKGMEMNSAREKKEGEKENWIGKAESIKLSIFKWVNNSVIKNEPWGTISFVLIGILIGWYVENRGYWNKCESVFAFIGFAFILRLWFLNMEHKITPYKKRGKGNYFLILTRSRKRTTISEANEYLKGKFPDIDICKDYIVCDEFVGVGNTLTPAEFEIITREAYKKFQQNKHKELGIVVDGPTGLAFMIGQNLGTMFRITFYQYDAERTDKYYPLPVVSKEWL